ncbi:MAG: hypothetical protein V1859_09295 [archaeon]
MSYVVITGTKRQQFDTLKDAVSVSSEESRIYLVDGFGNLSAVDSECIEQTLKAETSVQNQTQNEQPVIVTNNPGNAAADISKQQAMDKRESLVPVQKDAISNNNTPQKIVVVQKPAEENLLLRGLVFVVAVIIILFFIYMILKPYLEEFQSINSAFF